MSRSVVFNNTDHFLDAQDERTGGDGSFVRMNYNSVFFHLDIRIQQRNGRKCLTTVQGLATDLDLKKILRFIKKQYSTNGTIINDSEMGEVIRIIMLFFSVLLSEVQGDQRRNIYDALINWKICEKESVKVHGF